MNGLEAIKASLQSDVTGHEIFVDEQLRTEALIPLDRMLNFSAELKAKGGL